MTNDDLLTMLSQIEGAGQDMPSLSNQVIENCDLRNRIIPFPLDFTGAVFRGPAIFKNTGFRAGVSFTGVEFEDIADFSTCRFVDYAYFWNCKFSRTCSFFRTTFEPLVAPQESTRNPGEANFSYTRFMADVTFERARFGGMSYFHRTVFKMHADFAEARFDCEARFSGWDSDICVPANKIPKRCALYLRQQGLLCDCADQPKTHVNFDLRIKDADWLRDALEHPGTPRKSITSPRQRKRLSEVSVSTPASASALTEEEISQTVQLYKERHDTPLFSADYEISFRGVMVIERMIFSAVSLGMVRFEGCTIERCLFEYVSWAERKTTFALSSRFALHDEESEFAVPHFLANAELRSDVPIYEEGYQKKTTKEYEAIEKLYRDFRRRAEKDGEVDRAQDFYYGELEMRYRSKPRPQRWFTLIFLYRYASGFGKQHGLASLWLLLLIFGLFPAAYYVPARRANVPSLKTFIAAEARSLEDATLLSTRSRDQPVTSELVDGLERVLVPLQAGLLILAVRYNFQHEPRG